MDIGTDIFLLAVDPDRHGRPRYDPKLAPVLVLADLFEKVRRGRAIPDPILEYLQVRAPKRLRSYTDAAQQRGVLEVSVRKEGYFDHTRIKVVDQWPIDRAVDRLHRILDDPSRFPEDRDLVFLTLLDEVGRAQIHLGGWANRQRRRRLELLVTSATEDTRQRSAFLLVLREGLRAVREMSAQEA